MNFFAGNCSYAPEIKECINPPIDSMKACTGPVGHKDLESVKSAVSGAIDYACHDKGKRIKGSSFIQT